MMKTGTLIRLSRWLVLIVAAGTSGLADEQPRVPLPGRGQQAIPVGEEGPGQPWFISVNGEIALNPPAGPMLVVSVPADQPELIYGAKLLPVVGSEADVISAAEDVATQFSEAEALQSPAGGPFLDLDKSGGTQLPSNPDYTVQLATFRKVCEAGCAPFPQDLSCCTILGCSGPYRNCAIVHLQVRH